MTSLSPDTIEAMERLRSAPATSDQFRGGVQAKTEGPTRRQLMMLADDMGMTTAGAVTPAGYALAALARWGNPTPQPADGEVAELVALIRQIALAWEPEATLLGNMTAGQLARTADLLVQRYPQPVPLGERPWEREGWCDGAGKCWWGRSADEYCNHDWYYATRAEVEEFCSDAMPQVSLPAHALPTPEAK